MPSLNVRRSMVIQAPLDRVYAPVRSFRDWVTWCPWLLIEPGCERHFLQDNGGFAWESPVVGEARVEVTGEDGPRSLNLTVNWLKPRKSQADLRFAFRDLGANQGVEVTWEIATATPYAGLRSATGAAAVLDRDAGLGLAILKSFVETGGSPSRLDFPGRVFFPGGPYLGLRWNGSTADLASAIPASFTQLEGWMAKHGVAALGPRMTLCHDWNWARGKCELTLARPVGQGTAKGWLPTGFTNLQIPSCKAELVRHTGPYEFLPTAWSAAMARVNALKLSRLDALDPFEISENNLAEVPANQLTTAVYVPLRSS